MGQYVAKTIETELVDTNMRPDQRDPFKYWDKGTMATIGHSRAVAMIGGVKFSGFLPGSRGSGCTSSSWSASPTSSRW